MKRISAVVMALLLFAAPMAGADPEQTGSVTGDWYASADGLPVHLLLDADNTFTFTAPGQEPVSGVWELQDGYICVNGDRACMLLNDSAMVQEETGLLFTRGQAAVYSPAGAMEDASAAIYAGYWKAMYADAAGTPVPAFALEDETDLYVEGHSAILGGPVLGDTIVKLAERDGALVTEDGSAPAAELVLQQDGLLRLTVTGSDTAPQTWYMMRSYSAALDGETGEAP